MADFTIPNNSWTINEVRSCIATPAEGTDAYRLDVTLQDHTGVSIISDSYLSRPDDAFGANLVIRAWIEANV